MATSSPPEVPGRARRWQESTPLYLLYCLGLVVLVNTLIAVVLAMLRSSSSFAISFVHSQAIGLSVFALMFGPLLLMRRESGWRRLLLLGLCGLSIPAGFAIGLEVATRIVGQPSPLHGDAAGRSGLAGFMILTAIVSVVFGLFSWQRGRVAALELEAAHARERASLERMRAEAASHQAMEARFALLRAQLEPHMLFNTLANLRSLIRQNPEQALAMMDRLNAWLRATLSASRRDTVTLADEFALLRDYLALIAIRMGERLQVRLELPATLADAPVPALLLQPLVENAVRHGLEPLAEGGSIVISARLRAERLQLLVEDSGAGFVQAEAPDQGAEPDPGAMPRQGDISERAGSGFGLQQVRQRLQTLYGDRATLSIRSPWPKAAGAATGTSIMIDLPREPATRPPPHD